MLTRLEPRFPIRTGDADKDYDALTAAWAEWARRLNGRGVLQINEASEVFSSNPTGGIGYSTGAGGTVTQATNKGTGVTLNKVCGLITMNNAALGAGVTAGFVLTNSNLTTGSILLVQMYDGYATANTYDVKAETVGAGLGQIFVKNTSAGSLSEAVRIRFAVIKAVDT